MKDLDFTTLRLFVQVCETRSILRVSERENIVPSAITKRISKLEAELRVTLLRRGQGGVIPTPAGLALAANARSLLQESRRLHESLALYKDGAAGSVALMATNATLMADSAPVGALLLAILAYAFIGAGVGASGTNLLALIASLHSFRRPSASRNAVRRRRHSRRRRNAPK